MSTATLTTVQSAIAADTAALRRLTRSYRATLVQAARRHIASHPGMASANGFWRRLSAEQVMQA